MSSLPPWVFELAWQADARRRALARDLRRRAGVHRPLRILPYRGFGTRERACIRARVLEHRDVAPPSRRSTVIGSAIASYRRYVTVERGGIRVRMRWGDAVFDGTTDDEGFLELWVRPPPSATRGWNDVALELDEPGEHAHAPASVLIAPRRPRFVVVSDIDDTVIDTGVDSLFRRAWALFLSESYTRTPFQGVSAFYDALQRGRRGAEHNPVFYVSSSPYNLHEHIEEFLALHAMPAGPLLLRDWGLTRTGFAPGGGHAHKLTKIRLVMDALPDVPLLLVGDSGQEDPEHYVHLAEESPDRVLAIYIRDVTASPHRRAQLEVLTQRAREVGTVMVHVPDTVSAARHAAGMGWIRWRDVGGVRERRDEERATELSAAEPS